MTSSFPLPGEASIYCAVTMAEYYRDMGYHVLLLADSLSRWAEALREISSSLEEMPGEEGYPTYLASRLSGLFERAGVVETLAGETGSISMVLSVSPSGGDITEPVTQICLRAAGGVIMLDSSLAHRRHFPAVNWSHSYSLYAKELMPHFEQRFTGKWGETIKRCGELLQREEALREVVELVGLEGLQDPDRLLLHTAELIRSNFLRQNAYTEDAYCPPEKTLAVIAGIADYYDRASSLLSGGTTLEEALKA